MRLVPNDDWSSIQIMGWFLSFYTASGVVIVVFTILKVLVIQIIGFNASRKIHKKLLWRLMKAPVKYFDVTPASKPMPTAAIADTGLDIDQVKYFDVTPVGRIVNRFSSDVWHPQSHDKTRRLCLAVVLTFSFQ